MTVICQMKILDNNSLAFKKFDCCCFPECDKRQFSKITDIRSFHLFQLRTTGAPLPISRWTFKSERRLRCPLPAQS